MMFDDLKVEWKNEVAQKKNNIRLAFSSEPLEREANKIDKLVKKQNIIEITTAIVFLPFILYFLLNSENSVQSIGYSIWIYVCLITPYKLVKARMIKVDKNNSMKSYLQVEKLKTIEQLNLLRTFVWWHIIPILLGLILISAGSTMDETGTLHISFSLKIYYVLCTLGAIGIYFYNKKMADNKFKPLLDKINQRLDEIQDTF
ncbi:hypothetical protein [Colwellia piezophila]|uniref:hypothetical protein n=1 Tax=Colwellia piezophila TaxID=211668 RepID=UPI00036E3B97|nr:hypothetical protein [Colwellia piezophila]